MANRSYLRVWTRDFAEPTMIHEFARLLTTAPLSASHPEFDRASRPRRRSNEPIAAEWDLKGLGYGAAEVAALAAQHFNADVPPTSRPRNGISAVSTSNR